MTEKPNFVESIESKTAIVEKWVKNIGEQQKVGEIPVEILRDVLTHYGADFENLSVDKKNDLSKYAESKRTPVVKSIWGKRWDEYKSWVDTYVSDYESTGDKKLPRMSNVADIKNPERKSSERKDLGMLSFLADITAYAAGSLDYDSLKLILQTRAENGYIRELPGEKRSSKTKKILWDRELEPGKESKIKDPRYDDEGNVIPIDKQLIRPASFPSDFPGKAWNWICSRKAA